VSWWRQSEWSQCGKREAQPLRRLLQDAMVVIAVLLKEQYEATPDSVNSIIITIIIIITIKKKKN
jgi:putative effector of murein hydrolase